MSPETDVCPICEQHEDDMQSAMTGNDKLAAIDKYSVHLFEVKAERQVLYKIRNARIWIQLWYFKNGKIYSNIR